MASADILRAAHTELPWEAGSQATLSDPRMVYCNDATGQRVADCTGEYLFHTDEVMRANAAFIVRACNAHYQMLEALKNVLGSLETTLEFAHTQGGAKLLPSEKTAARIDAARAAIAAAEAEAGR